MMRRVTNLIDAIADPDNLRLAFYKARKGKRYAKKVQTFEANLDQNLVILREQILSGSVLVGDYHYFKIFDPKERQICAATFFEQVLHHALMNVCHNHFEKAQIYDSYASRPGKGIHAALHQATRFQAAHSWFLKLDIRKFFDSIHHETLKGQLQRKFKDERLLRIFNRIIDSYEAFPGRGVPIGNLTSQYFANHFLVGLDHFIKEQLKCRAYVRYMDDLVLWHRDKDWLKSVHSAIENYIMNQLQASLKPCLLNATSRGLPFLGYLIFPHYLRLTQRSKKRYIQKFTHLQSQYDSGAWDEATCQRRVSALVAFTRYADAQVLRKNVLTLSKSNLI